MPIDDFLGVIQPPQIGPADLGLPELPPPPQAPQPPAQKSGLLQTILSAAPGILGGAMGPGAGTGMLQGFVTGQARNEQMARQQQQDALRQFQIEQQTFNQQAQQHAQAQRQREQVLVQNLTALRSQVKDLPDKEAYDAYVEAYGHGLQSLGYRLDANWLRKAVPYVAPKMETKAWDVLQKWQAIPSNKTLLEKNPEHAANAMIPFDRDGDGTPELVRLQDLSVLAGAPLAQTAEGVVFSNPGTPLDVKANADGILQQLIAKAKAEGKQVTPELIVRLQQDAIRMAEQAKPQSASTEPLVAIMGPDGQPTLVPRSQAVGQRPASSREQGRPVMSSDANRIAELDTSLDDVAVLRQTLSGPGATGTAAKAGAMLPNVITELTGWGQDAKQRQAVIDRVKQVIGKALEGGVLRKEDEYKYVKILPTIYDPPEVAAAKLNGLEQAITLRRQRTLEALTDAGYDTANFSASEPSTSTAGEETVERGPDGKLRLASPGGR